MAVSTYSTQYVLRSLSAEHRAAWEHFVDGHDCGHLLQGWSWGELKMGRTWRPLRVALWDEATGSIVAGAQVLRRTIPYVPARLGHLAYIPRGPVIDWSNTALCETFFLQLHFLLAHQGAIALHMEPGLPLAVLARGEDGGPTDIELCLARPALPAAHAIPPVQPLRTIVLNLETDEEALLAKMKEKWRYNVRLAARKGVIVRAAQTLEDVHSWYRLLETTAARDNFGIHTREYYVRAWKIMTANNEACLLLAEYDGRLLAGIFVALQARQAIYLYGASDNEGRQLMPNYALQWEAIRWAKQRGALYYDFWGIPATDAASEAMAGVYRFKSGWGGNVVQFPGGFEYVYRAFPMRIARRYM